MYGVRRIKVNNKVINKVNKKRANICSTSPLKTPEQCP